MVDVFETFWDDAAVLAAINLGLWVLTLVIGKAWPVDFIWSSWQVYRIFIYGLLSKKRLFVLLAREHC